MPLDYLRSRTRRGRWFHYYRHNGREIPLGVHGLAPDDARVIAAYAAEHMRGRIARRAPRPRKPGRSPTRSMSTRYRMTGAARPMAPVNTGLQSCATMCARKATGRYRR